MMQSRVLSAVCCMILWTGCSVKENREACPCRLYLDFGNGFGGIAANADLAVFSENGFLHSDKIGADVEHDEYMVMVPRSGVRVNVCCGAEGYLGSEGSVAIPSGSGCPRVYMHSSYVDTGGDVACARVAMHKNHCVITVNVGESEFPYSLNVRGDIAGYDRTGQPSAGEFTCLVHPDSEGMCTVSVPRQIDRTLVLDVDDGTNVLKTFALGEYVAESGYDWNAENLEDITIGLDYSLSHITLKVDGWDKELQFNVEI